MIAFSDTMIIMRRLFILLLVLLLSHQKSINPQNLVDDYDPSATQAIFNNQPLAVPGLAQADALPPNILGQTTANKRIEIDLTNQRLYAFEDNNLIYNFLISSGKWARTPTGTFQIWTKLRYSKMEGGSKAIHTYYYLPNVPYIMYFYNDAAPKSRGFGLHGTYWHSNFGHPMSHGCINMKTEEAEQIYYWALPNLQGKKSMYASADNPGTSVTIYGEAAWE